MFDIIPLAIILVSLVVVIVIVVRKFPEVSKAKDQKQMPLNDQNKDKTKLSIPTEGLKKFGLMVKDVSVAAVSKTVDRVKDIKKKKADQETEAKEATAELSKLVGNKPVIKKEDPRKEYRELFNNAESLRKSGENKEAEKIYIDIISKDPQNALAYLGLGEVCIAMKNYKDAEESFRETLRRDRGNNDALKGIEDAKRGRIEGGEEEEDRIE